MYTKTDPGYDNFYAKGGWKYSEWGEKRKLLRNIIKPIKLEKGSKLLEIGCGMGLRSHLLSKLGFDVTGVDISEVGIKYAQDKYRSPKYMHLDAGDLGTVFEFGSFDIIFASGMSWYHYGLDGVGPHSDVDVPARTQEFFRYLRKDGIFILQIVTDFSGNRPAGGIHQNEFKDYVELFEKCGEIFYISDLNGKTLRNEEDAKYDGFGSEREGKYGQDAGRSGRKVRERQQPVRGEHLARWRKGSQE